MNINYQKETEKVIEQIKNLNYKPRLLLHSCCAPCSSYVLEYLSPYFEITILYYNPNIFPETEFEKRLEEQIRFSSNFKNIKVIDCGYEHNEFLNCVRGLGGEEEGGNRCFLCYELRLEKTAKLALNMEFDYFTTTLSISPLKNCKKLNEISYSLSEKYGVKYLPADFKKRNGFKRSIELSQKYSLYRQNFCGCEFSIQK